MMTTISIVPESLSASHKRYRAVAGARQSVGSTPGEALDTISAQMDDCENGTLLVIQHMRPDRFFTEAQRTRLANLMAQWRASRDLGEMFPVELQAELDQLVASELDAATQRSSALLNDSRP